MKKFCSITLFIVLGIMFAVCQQTFTQDKMPITTSSDEALNDYLQGLDLVDNFRIQEAREFFQSAVDKDPDFALAHLQLAGVQATAKDFFDSFEKAKALIDRVSEAEKLRILGFEDGAIKGDLKSQLSRYNKLVTMYPNDERSHYVLGTTYFLTQNWEKAAAEYQKAIKIKPSFAVIYNQLGYTYRFLKQYNDAEKAFKNYIKLIPDDPNPYDSYAELLMKMGRFDESIEQYRAALKMKPDFLNAYSGIASNLNFKGQHEEAREQLTIMYNLATDDGQRRAALTAMAFSYIDEGDFDSGIKEYEKRYALAEAIGDTSAMAGDLAIMGFALVEVKGREQEALDKFEISTAMIQASSLSENIKTANRQGFLYNASRAYVAMGNVEQARTKANEYRVLAETNQNQNQIRAAYQLDGLISLEEGKFDEAVEQFLQSNLENPWNLYYIGKTYEGKGDIANARVYYKKAANFNGINSSPQACIRRLAVERSESL